MLATDPCPACPTPPPISIYSPWLITQHIWCLQPPYNFSQSSSLSHTATHSTPPDHPVHVYQRPERSPTSTGTRDVGVRPTLGGRNLSQWKPSCFHRTTAKYPDRCCSARWCRSSVFLPSLSSSVKMIYTKVKRFDRQPAEGGLMQQNVGLGGGRILIWSFLSIEV